MLTVPEFVKKWSVSGAAESSNAQSFTNDLCEVLGVTKPDPTVPDESQNTYVFEKSVPTPKGNVKKIDCYKRGHFILENKQGATLESVEALSAEKSKNLRARKTGHGKRGTHGWDVAMEKAKKQAENYARLLDGTEIKGGRPPFIMVADVGHSVALYADWSRAGGIYQPFPDPNNYRIPIRDLHREELRDRLRLVWTDPLALDPARRSARVTKLIADRLAKLAKSLEGEHATEVVAGFLMRCLFTMFAEDAGLLPEKAFTNLLERTKEQPQGFVPNLTSLWQTMDKGGWSIALNAQVKHFNGGLFADQTALPLNEDEIQLLVEAARADWREVEPAIFGTLLERALDPRERHSLGAHYTPRAYVERLVQPTILEPLRHEWESVQTAALALAEDGETDKAIKSLESFLQRLADLRVLDPACGSGNFLYVTLELLKRLEGEVRNTLRDLGQGQISIGLTGATITPENMLGIEINPRAAAIAELVLWIGYLQWHLRSTGDVNDLGEPIIRDYHNIENRDAVLAWERTEPLLDDGNPVTRWDGVTFKTHPVTSKQVPDEAARTQALQYIGANKAEWPEADFIVGNPPFIGTARMRESLGDGYTEALRKAYKNVPDSADFVMFWWDTAAEAVRNSKTRRFGFITTNSIRQTFNRRVIQHHLSQSKPLSIVFAVPDHPWVDNADGAAVRIAMTSVENGEKLGGLITVLEENSPAESEAAEITFKEQIGKVQADLTVGANVAGASSLDANSGLSHRGMQLSGSGFIVERSTADIYNLECGIDKGEIIKEYRNGRDLTSHSRDVLVIDLFGYEIEKVRQELPVIYQHVYDRVKPERDQNRRKSVRENWWIYGEARVVMRAAMKGLDKYITTVETSRHRFFTFLDKTVLPDNKLVNIALDDAHYLGVLSSSIHVVYSLAAGSWLGVGNDSVYAKTRCFETFPFPSPTEDQKQSIRNLAERLDAHRKRQQAQQPKLTMTGLYNVLEKLRSGEPLDDKERKIHEQGLVGILKQLHDELDVAVAKAYGWEDLIAGDPDSSEAKLRDDVTQEILQRLVDLNAERAAEEAKGLVRWLRPEYQAPEENRGVQSELELDEDDIATVAVVAEKRKWPKDLTAQVTTLRDLLREAGETPLSLSDIAEAFKPKLTKKRQGEAEKLLEMMESLGQAEITPEGYRA
ncbi:type II restriction/modification system DNA methylase subunit YeeA [Neolewinella xylanilytica]|uniref:site-specific DNA-methyltransferase (adenine-specific) n=1 Tax=Neolewinella xylanilytica TaxID=1514080 RepID=A0A2S6I797_9BACT|nr:DNA methyltransferase [Neolewinella xylanilytica]PPK87329.1 type II restriction/modification system DNA methylase subunit YeeA [Neolewinella xylanilytica]